MKQNLSSIKKIDFVRFADVLAGSFENAVTLRKKMWKICC